MSASEQVGVGGVTAEEIRVAFAPPFVDVTTTVEVVLTEQTWEIRGLAMHSDGRLVARFLRRIWLRRGVLVATHCDLTVEPEFWGSGYMTGLLRTCFPHYRRMGIRYVYLEADREGLFAWPTLGWSLHGEGIEEVRREIDAVYAGRHGVKPPSDMPLPLFGIDLLGATNGLGPEALEQIKRRNGSVAMRLDLESQRAREALAKKGIEYE